MPIGERRDNTPQNCPDLGFKQLISTDYVSAYQWPTVADARHRIEVGTGGREDARVGQVVLLFGGNSDVWPYETAPYVRAVREAQ